MKAALVYTSTTPELIELVEREVRENIGPEAELLSLQDPGILAEVRAAGFVTPAVGRSTLSSLRFGARELKKALQAKGLIPHDC